MGSALILAVALLGSTPAGASVDSDSETLSKKQRYLLGKSEPATKRRAPATEVVRVVYARNLHTHEVMAIEGPGVTDAAIDTFLRCWFTHESREIPAELVARIRSTAHHFKARSIHIVSGFRHPKYNTMLRKKGREVALKSQHTEGHAVDFSLVGVDAKTLYRFLLKEHDGGVGFYPRSGFVHVDTGRKRTWKGS